MKKIKSHFVFTRKQQNGILLLVLLILIAQSIYFFVDVPSKAVPLNQELFMAFENELDSLRKITLDKKKPTHYPFNPNFITDYKGYTLGMNNEEIDRLLAYRSQNKWINSKKQFQEVTKVSDSLLEAIAPYFKFPEWVSRPKEKSFNGVDNYNAFKSKTFAEKIDLNVATKLQLRRINGIGEALSSRIIKYRNKFEGGFIADIQLYDVYGLTPEVIDRVKEQFTVKTPRQIEKLFLNTASVEDLVTVQHIDYELAYEIINERTLREGFKSWDELTKVKDFPIDKIEIIKLYLRLQ